MKNKSSHITTYPVKILKLISDIVSPILSIIIGKSLRDGVFPASFKKARVVPLHKGGCTSDVGNYRPVSVLPMMSKIFERVVFNQLIDFLDKYNLLNPSQYGFRAGKSTSLAVMDHLQYVYENLDSGNIVVSIFLDFSKAFDCIEHEVLLGKLFRCGVRGVAYRWFESYLSERTQYVSINSTNSTFRPVTHGVPQGSILGPLLFLIFINDFPKSSSFFKFTLFADDSTLSCKFNSTDPNLISNTLNIELEIVNNWLINNKIKVNHNKSKFILFSYRRNLILPNIYLGNNIISETETTKFLGIIIDKKLNFKAHINQICNKISKSIGLLYRLNKFLPFEPLKILYHTLVAPHISYGIESWYGAPQCASNRIIVLQKKAIRAIHSLPYNCHTKDYFKSAHILNVAELFNLKLGIHMYNMFTTQNFSTNSDLHDHNTRNRNNIITPHLHRTRSQSCWMYRGIHLWNTMPVNLRECETSNQFKRVFKNFIMEHQ